MPKANRKSVRSASVTVTPEPIASTSNSTRPPTRGRPPRRQVSDDTVHGGHTRSTVRATRSRSPSLAASVRWDPDNPQNWDMPVLRNKLFNIGIVAPTGVDKKFLLKLYTANFSENAHYNKDGGLTDTVHVREFPETETTPTLVLRTNNSGRPRTQVRATTPADDVYLRPDVTNLDATAASIVEAVRWPTSVPSDISVTSRARPEDNSAVSVEPRDFHIATSASTLPTITAMAEIQKELNELRGMVSHMRQGMPNTVEMPAVTVTAATPTLLLRSTPVAPDSLPQVETVSTSMRKLIVEGKLVNLAALLIPHSEAPDCRTTEIEGVIYKLRDDPRLNKTLTLGEFIAAFSAYKNVLCDTYLHRRAEMDAYERQIVQIARQYGGTLFYDYHRLFASKAAAWVAKGVLVNWGLLDTTLYCTVTSGHRTRACSICHSLMHEADMCPTLRVDLSGNSARRGASSYRPSSSGPYDRQRNTNPNVDTNGRSRQFVNNMEVCNNFNLRSCYRGPSCHFAHICLKCKSSGHGSSTCGDVNRGNNPAPQNKQSKPHIKPDSQG
jgi:hypothetical protein